MDTNSNAARSMPSDSVISGLSDAELLERTRRLVGRSNQLLAELLAHLAEVETRGVHRTRACSSLYTYCIYELRFSEDEAFRRVAAARLVKRFPALLDALIVGELHLTGLLMLGPHLTAANFVEVLARAKHRTKREIAALVRILDPLPAVPARIEPLGPAPARVVPPVATWAAFGQALCPVRELAPGDRPRDWVDGANDGVAAGAVDESSPDFSGAANVDAVAANGGGHVEEYDAAAFPELAPQRYAVQFTATDEYVGLVQEARALLSHTAPQVTLAELQLRALRVFVAGLKKRKYATKERSDVRAASATSLEATATSEATTETSEATTATSEATTATSEAEAGAGQRPRSESGPPRRRGRHVSAAVRRAVFSRDDGRCGYVDAGGRRCAETRLLEFHHLEPFAGGGGHALSNIVLRCRAHNTLAAEADFGRDFIADKRCSEEHEPFRWQSDAR